MKEEEKERRFEEPQQRKDLKEISMLVALSLVPIVNEFIVTHHIWRFPI
jgi:hypothetical protein